MFPWTLHYRLLMAVLIPGAALLVLLPVLSLLQYQRDLESQFLRIGHSTMEAATSIMVQAPPAALDAWLQRQLRHDSLRRISVLDRDGRVLAEAGAGSQPMPAVRTLSRTEAAAGRIIRRDADDATHWISALPDARWLVLTASRQPQKLAFYQALMERGVLVLVSLLILVALVRIQLRRTLRPLGQLAQALHNLPPGQLPRLPPAARQIWPDFVDQIEQGMTRWQSAFDDMRNSSERAEEELRETLDAIERQNIDLHAARREAVASNQLKSEFLANISHEIRTPLSSLIGFARLLEKTPLSARQQDHVSSLVHAAEHLLAILNDLLDLSKIEAGRLVLDETPVALRELLSDTIDMLAPLTGDKPLTLHGEVGDEVPGSVLGDPLRLRQIMTNLINNAIKFTPRGEVRAGLRLVSLNGTEAMLELSVRDTGIGIQPRQLDGLFDAFQQADSSTSRRFGGTGLGLTITRQLVQLMGGSISVDSRPGLGSTFTVRWNARLDPFRALQPARRTHSLPDCRQLARLDPPLRVLVVDDHPANLKLLRTWLQELGIAADTADNGLEAVSLATRELYDLVFMDIQMPGMNGLEAAQAIRAGESRGQRVPIIALTAHALSSEREFWLRSGIDDYVGKPLQESQLLHILQQWTRFVSVRPAVVDWDEARRLAGDKADLAEELLRTLIADLPRSLAALAQADTAEEARAWWQEAHRLLGACRYCGVPALRESLEDALRTRGEDPAMPPAAAVAGSVLAEIRALRDWSADHLPVSAAPCG